MSQNQLLEILDQIAAGDYSEADINAVREALVNADELSLLQLGKYNINIEKGEGIHIGDRTYVEWNEDAIQALIRISRERRPQLTDTPHNLPISGVVEFVGREIELALIHEQLEEDSRTMAYLSGMGGIGKTELALQYALEYKREYTGGICWLQARAGNIATQIVAFARSRCQIVLPTDLDPLEQVNFCWGHWPIGKVLVVLDDVTDYQKIKSFLPPEKSRFNVLMTARLRLGRSIKNIPIDILRQDAAINLLATLIGDDRVRQEKKISEELCGWLGNLPLGIELIGRYIDRKPDIELQDVKQRLEKQRLEFSALQSSEADMTNPISIISAFELSWEILPTDVKKLAYLTSLFATSPFSWQLVLDLTNDSSSENVEDLRDDYLMNLHLLSRREKGIYQVHQLIKEFINLKAGVELVGTEELRRRFCVVLSQEAELIPESPVIEEIEQLAITIPHIVEVVTTLSDALPNDTFTVPFQGLNHFYRGQGLYGQAEEWSKRCVLGAKDRFPAKSKEVAVSLSSLGSVYLSQAAYKDAEPLFQEALEIRENVLSPQHVDVAESLNDLALLKKYQEQHSDAEPLYIRSLQIRNSHFGESSLESAESLNNLGLLYEAQGRYQEAEASLNRSLAIRQAIWSDRHPDVAESLNNLASLYHSQEKYDKAFEYYSRSLTLKKLLLGDEHRDVATALSNLGQTLSDQKKYSEAESHLKSALRIRYKLLGRDHPETANTLNNLGVLYVELGNLKKSKRFHEQALDIRRTVFDEHHLLIANSYNNLAKCNYLQENYAEAVVLYLKAQAIVEDVLGSGHYVAGIVRDGLLEAKSAMESTQSSL